MDKDGDRLAGWGYTDWNESNPYTPLVNGGDFRSIGGVHNVNVHTTTQSSSRSKRHYNIYTAFHFHNFFAESGSIRFKYKTYGHPNRMASKVKLDELHEDLALMVDCARNEPDRKEASYKRVQGGFENLDPFTPIYFQDADYRRRKQESIRDMIVSDEVERNKRILENRMRENKKNEDANKNLSGI